MNLASLQFPTFKPYQAATIEIYISGCNRKCEGCHNPELHDFNFGKPLVTRELLLYIHARVDLIKNIALLGGDLLQQDLEEALFLVGLLRLNFPDKKLWLFTGAEREECPEWVWNLFDVVKTGRFDKEVYNEVEEAFPITNNQIVLIKGEDY